MPVHDRYGGIPAMPDSEGGFHLEPPPQPTPEQIAAFKAQLTEEATEKQAAKEKNSNEMRVILARELRNHHLHVLFMNDQALLEARVSGVAKAEKTGPSRIVLTIDIEMPMPTASRDPARHLEIPPVIEAHGDSVDIHLDGHAPRMGEIGHDPARPGRVHLEFAVSNPDEIPNLTFHRTEGALFSTLPFPGREMPPLAPLEKPAEKTSEIPAVAASPKGQSAGFDTHQEHGARRHAGIPAPSEEAPASVSSLAREIPGAGTRIKSFFQRPTRSMPATRMEVPPGFIPPVIFDRKDFPHLVDGKPAPAPVRPGGSVPFTGPISLSARPQPRQAPPVLPGDPIPTGEKIPLSGESIPMMPGAPVQRHSEVSEITATRITESPTPIIGNPAPIIATISGESLKGTATPMGPRETRDTPSIRVDATDEVFLGAGVHPLAVPREIESVEAGVTHVDTPVRMDTPVRLDAPFHMDMAVQLEVPDPVDLPVLIDAPVPVDAPVQMDAPVLIDLPLPVGIQVPVDTQVPVDGPHHVDTSLLIDATVPAEGLPKAEIAVAADTVRREMTAAPGTGGPIDPLRPEARAWAVAAPPVTDEPARFGVPDPEQARVELPHGPLADRLAAHPASDAGGHSAEKHGAAHRRHKAESKDEVIPTAPLGAAMPHRFGSDAVRFAENPAPHASGRSGDDQLAHEVVQMVERFLVTADAGSYVKELHMTLNPDILPGTEIRFRMVDQSLTVTFVNKDGNAAERLREEVPELAESLRAALGSDVEIRIEAGEGTGIL